MKHHVVELTPGERAVLFAVMCAGILPALRMITAEDADPENVAAAHASVRDAMLSLKEAIKSESNETLMDNQDFGRVMMKLTALVLDHPLSTYQVEYAIKNPSPRGES